MVSPSPSLFDQYLADRPAASPGWDVVVRNEARVLERLKRGQCDGLLPDVWLAPDDLLHFALDRSALALFATLPDPRKRRTIPAALLGTVLLAGTLPDLASLRQIGTTLFHSAVLLDQLGVNFVQTRTGGARTGDERPFDVEALGDFLAGITPAQYTAHAQTVAAWLRTQPECAGTTWALDCVDVRIPKGRVKRDATAETTHLKVAVLSVITPLGALPVLWRFGTPQDGDITLARPLWEAAVALWGHGACHQLLVDAGFLDGAWLTTVHAQGTTVLTRLREDMDPMVAAQAYVPLHPDLRWQAMPVPRRPAGHERPVRREIAGLPDWPGWDAYGQDLAVCLVRDTYANGTVDLWGLMSTHAQQTAESIYRAFGQRWQLEETYMALSRYHHLNAVPASRVGVACARVHALLCAYTLRALCRADLRRQQAAGSGKPWRRRTPYLLLYTGGYFGIFKPSVVLEVILTHADVWRTRQAEILAAVRFCEGEE